MEKTVTVHVTAEGITRDGHNCNDYPVFDGMVAAGVPVKKVHCTWWEDISGTQHTFPPRVKEWLFAYDERIAGLTAIPFSFELTYEEIEL